MSSGIAPPEQAPPSQPELLIDARLRQTRRQLAGVEIADGLITLAAGVLVFLLAAAALDHWLIPGGIGFYGRLFLFLVLLVGGGAYFVRKILPLLVYRIHPLFAAQVIEETRPGMKNSLVNFLFLRKQPEALGRDAIAHRFYHGLERTTAAELAEVDVTTTVDRAGMIRHGYVLAGVLAILCLYLVLSPKSPLVSIRRVIWPWANVAPPTRVSITDIEPGDTTAFQGDLLPISGKVSGLRDGESVLVYYTTADGQSVDQAVPMTLPEGGYRHGCELPPTGDGLQQDLTYYLAAGDFRSRRYSVKVETALAIPVEELYYDYPAYTGLPDRTERGVGDVKAVEGTRVTVRATANQPIRQAAIEMDCDARRRITMKSQGVEASGQFTLGMLPDDRTRPRYDSYQIRFTDQAGHENRRPIRYRVDVIPDAPPTVRFVDPPPESIELPVDGVLPLKVRAEDPDFALRRLVLHAEHDGRRLPIRPLLEKPRPEKAHEGPFEGSFRFEPAKLNLAVGDEIEYWAEASDNRENETGPAPNRTETTLRRIKIVAANSPMSPEGDQQDPKSDPGAEKPDQGEQQADKPDQAMGDQGASQQQSGDAGENQQSKEAGQDGQPQDEGQQEGEGDSQNKGDSQSQGKPQDQGEQSSDGQAGQGDQPQDGQQPQSGQQNQGSGDQSSQTKQDQPQANGQGEGDQQGTGGQPSDANQQGGGNQPSNEPIDGQTNPGDAFEKILEYKDEQDQQQSGGAGQNDQPQTGAEPGDSPPQGPRQDQQGTPAPNQPSDGQGPSKPGDAEGGKPTPDRDAQAQQSNKPATQGERTSQRAKGDEDVGQGTGEQPKLEGQPRSDVPPGQPNQDTASGQMQQKPTDGQGAQSQGAGQSEPPEKSDSNQSATDSAGGNPSEPQGDPGAGKPSTDSKGSPSPQEANQPRDKMSDNSDQAPSDGGEAKSPTTSPKQSDSQGDSAGDRSGGGEEGGGQRSEQEGTGSAGSHTPSEQGGSRSNQQGQGETGNKPGDQAKSDSPTGQSDKTEQGPGSGSRAAPGGQKPGGQKTDQSSPPGGPPDPADQPGTGDASSLDPNAQGPQSSGNPMPGGKPGQQPGSSSGQQQEMLGGEDINLDYARRQTELALEYLEDQLDKDEPDQNLLNRLGWTRDDMEAFVRRWQEMRRAAGSAGKQKPEAKKELDEALKSLNLKPRTTEIQSGQRAQDELRRLKDSGRHEPPAKWKALFEAYTRSISSPTE